MLYLRRVHQTLYMLTESGMFLLILNEATPSETGAYICINQLDLGSIIERLPYPTFDSKKVDQIRVYGSIPKIYVVGS